MILYGRIRDSIEVIEESDRNIRGQWTYIHHIIDTYPLLWDRIMYKFNVYLVYDLELRAQPRRNIGHPRLRWDDHIKTFCWKRWPQNHGRHWFDILSHYKSESYENEYVLFMSNLS